MTGGGLLFGALIRGHARARLFPSAGRACDRHTRGRFPQSLHRDSRGCHVPQNLHRDSRGYSQYAAPACTQSCQEGMNAKSPAAPPIYIRHGCKIDARMGEWGDHQTANGNFIASANPISVLASYCSDSNQCSVLALWKFHLSFAFG